MLDPLLLHADLIVAGLVHTGVVVGAGTQVLARLDVLPVVALTLVDVADPVSLVGLELVVIALLAHECLVECLARLRTD